MCSIAGAAGPIHKLSSKLRQEFHEFLSCLFTMAELRGRDASGFWVWRNNHYVFEKRPTPAEDLIQRSPRWKGLRFNPGSLYLLHTRAATDGDPNENMNNHPHMGEHSVMIHNGMIWGHGAIAQQYQLDMKTDCDSEVLLRLAECMDKLKDGLKFMFETTNSSTGTDSIATAFIDRRKPDRIFLSRNNGNPCYLYKSKRFGCTFFVSTEDIFERALEMLYKSRSPKVIGAKSENTNANWLYQLLDTGEIEKELLVKPTYNRGGSNYNSYSNYGHEEDDDESTTIVSQPQYYIKTIVEGNAMSVSLTGQMSLLSEEIVEEEEEELEFTDTIKMPREEEEELRGFLDEVIAKGLD